MSVTIRSASWPFSRPASSRAFRRTGNPSAWRHRGWLHRVRLHGRGQAEFERPAPGVRHQVPADGPPASCSTVRKPRVTGKFALSLTACSSPLVPVPGTPPGTLPSEGCAKPFTGQRVAGPTRPNGPRGAGTSLPTSPGCPFSGPVVPSAPVGFPGKAGYTIKVHFVSRNRQDATWPPNRHRLRSSPRSKELRIEKPVPARIARRGTRGAGRPPFGLGEESAQVPRQLPAGRPRRPQEPGEDRGRQGLHVHGPLQAPRRAS